MIDPEDKTPQNERPWSHRIRGILFECDRCDLRDTITVTIPKGVNGVERLFVAMSEHAAWHALNIYPKLNGFQGYNTLRFKFVWDDGSPCNLTLCVRSP